MNRSLFDNIAGLKYDPARYKGLPGKIRYFALVYSVIVILVYVLLTAGVLPLFIRGYESLGSDKSRFWMMNYEFCGRILLAAPLFLFMAFILGVIAYHDDEEESGSLLESGYIASGYYTGTGFSVFIWIMLFMLGVSISFFLSQMKETAIAGEEGWYCGMQQYMAVGVCILLIVLLKVRHTFFLMVALLSSFAVNITGLIMDIGGNVFGLTGWTEEKVSTVGNANWYCGYIVTVFFLGIALYYVRGECKSIADRINTVFLTAYIFIGAYMYVAQGSASGFVALYAVFVALLIISGDDLKKLLRVSEIFVIFSSGLLLCSVVALLTDHVRANDAMGRFLTLIPFADAVLLLSLLWMISIMARIRKGRLKALFPIGKVIGIGTAAAILIFLVLLVVNTSMEGRLFGEGILFFAPRWGSKRGMTISIGVRMFVGMTPAEKIFGTGPDTFYSLLTGGRFPVLAAECNEFFHGARLTNAHSEPITLLVNTGIFGMVCYYGMLLSVLAKTVKASVSGCEDKGGPDAGKRNGSRRGFVLGVSLCIIAYIVNNLFSFQTVMNLSQLSLILGFGVSAVLNCKTEE